MSVSIRTSKTTPLKYTVIKNEQQYIDYCNTYEELEAENHSKSEDEIELLYVLISKWDDEHSFGEECDPIAMLKNLMKENSLKSKDISEILNLSKGTVSKILNYKKGLSKTVIRKLAEHFRLRQEAFNKEYDLV